MSKDKIKVLYIAGYQRSGSTILQNILGELEGFFAIGELRSLWKEGLTSRPCGCGEKFSTCSTWQGILQNAFGNDPQEQIQEMSKFYQAIRSRNVYKLFLPGHDKRLISKLNPFLNKIEQLYKCIQETTGCKVIVDSSKTIMYAYILGLIPSIDVYVLHLVRDSRGTQYSLIKRKNRNHLRLQNHTVLKGSFDWNFTNFFTEKILNNSDDRYLRLHYEAIIEQPKASIKNILDLLGEESNESSVINTNIVTMGIHHTFGGSPHRFTTGNIRLNLDDQWQTKMNRMDKKVTTLVTSPLLLRYGYSDSIPQYLKYFWRLFSVGIIVFTRGIGSLLYFLLNIILGNTLGAAGAGIYYLFSSWSRVLGMIGGLGLPIYTLRNVSVLEGEKKHKDAKEFVFNALMLSTLVGIALTVFINTFTPYLARLLLDSSELAYVLRFAAPAGILFISLEILGNALIGREQANLAITLKNNILPAGLIIFLIIGINITPQLPPSMALWGHLLISTIAIIFGLWKWFGPRISIHISQALRKVRSDFRFKNLRVFWLINIFRVSFANLPILLLPRFATAAEIGYFGVALRFVTMSVTIMDALQTFFAPRFARHYAHKETRKLSQDLYLSQLYSILIYIPFVIIFIFFAEPLLGIVGDDFVNARNLLWIMTFGQLINSATGLAGIMLNMINQEKIGLYLNILSMFIMTATILVMGRLYGVIGVAWGYSISISLKFLLLYYAARKSISA